jgi:flavin-dependent dehydrogenase
MADGRDFDVAIVGAGAAGIAACHRLSAAKLRVVEARPGAAILSPAALIPAPCPVTSTTA